ncbi:MAG: ABC transporter ATP-binding protein [Gemmatimonadota bacterium]
MAMIVAEDVTKTYPSGDGRLTVLHHIDLEIEAEDSIAIVGPSGSGKTTLLGLLAGLDRPTTGKVWLDGTRLDTIDEDARARLRSEKVGFVFQTFQLLPTLTALENVCVPLELAPGRAATHVEYEHRALALLDRVGLADRADHYPVQLSGGEQQRVSLARAFAHRPTVLFADEPTGNLDRDTGARVIELLRELNDEMCTTLVLVTHDLDLAALADQVIRLEAGRLTPA